MAESVIVYANFYCARYISLAGVLKLRTIWRREGEGQQYRKVGRSSALKSLVPYRGQFKCEFTYSPQIISAFVGIWIGEPVNSKTIMI